jgi:hypothetical protein
MKDSLPKALFDVPRRQIPAIHPFCDSSVQNILKMGFSFAKVRAVDGEESARRP